MRATRILILTSYPNTYSFLQYDLQRDLGDMSNLKSYLSARLQKMDINQQNFMHLTRKYYHQVAGNELAVDRQRWSDVHRSRHVHLYGRLTGLTNGMTHLLPPNVTFDFKVRLALELAGNYLINITTDSLHARPTPSTCARMRTRPNSTRWNLCRRRSSLHASSYRRRRTVLSCGATCASAST